MSQFESKCCNARVYQELIYENDPSEQPKWRCSKCKKIVEYVILSKHTKRTR